MILAARPIVRGLNLRLTIRLHHGRGFRDRLEGAHDRASPGSLVELLERRRRTTLALPLLRLVLFPLIVRSLQLRGADALLGQQLDSRMDLWEAKKARLEVLTGELVCLAEADGDDARRTPCAGHLYGIGGWRPWSRGEGREMRDATV